MNIFQKCHDFTEAREVQKRGLYPFFIPIEESRGSKVVMKGKELIMIGSNNYLGLSWDPRVMEASINAIKEYGTSCSGSRFANGTLALHEELEYKLAKFTGKEAALCFSTGYQTNLGAISALVGRNEHIITDRYNHASIMDGIFLASGMKGSIKIHRYFHNDIENLESVISQIPHDEPKLIVTDGVFSMEGDIVKLPELRRVADKYNAALYIDEAHAIGVIGDTGRGSGEYYGNKVHSDLLMCTFSKSFGSLGGFIAGDEIVIDYIKHFARPLIFSASMPPATIASVAKALEIIETEPEHVKRLQEIAKKMLKGFKSLGFNIGVAETPIIPLVIGNNEKTFLFWKALFENGIYANPVISPAVPPDRSLIRTSFMAIHTDDELDQVLEIAGREAKKLGII
ncbi:MAG: 8-amino-7-oxononanoate synthase [Spirochaetes bacterium]|nr:MAG: 8-amino-7-oxononanoate synthase [Spirochaetota bacterium]